MSVRYLYTTIKAIEGDQVFWCEVPKLRSLIDAITGSVVNDEAVYLDLRQCLQKSEEANLD